MAELTFDGQDDGDGSFGELTEREPEDSTEGSEPVEETQPEAEAEVTETEEEGETESEETEESGEEPELTEKGTKLDKNPLSRAHQELANERRKTKQLEAVLQNPTLLAEYMKTLNPNGQAAKQTPAEEQELKEYTAEDFKDLNDVAKVVNDINRKAAEGVKASQAEIERLNNLVGGLMQGGHATQVAVSMERDVTTLRGEKELDPNSEEFIPGLEEEIAATYHNLDFDEETGSYRGKHSLAEIGQQFLKVARDARKQGSQKTQTIVKNKKAGAVKTSPTVKEELDNSEMSPGDSIAKGISKMNLRV